MQKSLLLVISIAVFLGAGFFFLQQKPAEPAEGENRSGLKEETIGDLENISREDLLLRLKEAAQTQDYSAFAQYLKVSLDRGWYQEADFQAVESEAYVTADQAYFISGNFQKTLEISTIVYNQVPQGWRFQYLRVLALEKLGRMALEQNDLQGAEEYAAAILKMTFRPEGANLLADVYIQKIEESLRAGNLQEALNNYNFIKDFEVSEDRRVLLEELMN